MITLQDRPALEGSRLGQFRRAIGLYAVAGVLCLVAEILLFELWNADLRVPLYYLIGHDHFTNIAFVKNVIETGLFFTYPRLGAPGLLITYDFPSFDHIHYIIIKLITWAIRDFGIAFNFFYLLSFLLITWTSLFVMRRSGVSRPVAVVSSLLYAFAPYHFMRGQMHTFLGAYFSIPLLVLLLLRLSEGRSSFVGQVPSGRRLTVAAFTVITCVLVAGSGVYATFFSLYFIAIATLIGYSRAWRVVRLIDGAIVFALLLGLFLAEAIPNILHNRDHGKNPVAVRRNADEAVKYGLSVSTMVRTTPYHQFKGMVNRALGRGEGGPPPAGELLNLYEDENQFVALGLFGTFGFLTLIAVPFLVRRPPGLPTLFGPLGKLNLAGVLLAVPGGLGHLVALYVTPNIRAYNRISIYLAYFSVLAAALLLDRLRRSVIGRPRARLLSDVTLGLILAVGLVDQMPRIMRPDYGAARATFARDHEYFRRVESMVPAGSMVFQLPYAPFPEGYSDAREDDWSYLGYEHIRAFVHTDRIRWSSPTMKGREWDRWQARLWEEPVGRVVEELARVGFAGISIDREGYEDQADGTIAELRRIVGPEPLESPDHRFIFFPLKPANPPAAITGPR